MTTAAFERRVFCALLMFFFLGLVTARALFVGRFLERINSRVLHFLVMTDGTFTDGHGFLFHMMALHAGHDLLMLAVRKEGRLLPRRRLHDHFFRTDTYLHAEGRHGITGNGNNKQQTE